MRSSVRAEADGAVGAWGGQKEKGGAIALGASQFGEHRPLAARRAEAEHELSLFHCLRVWAYCIERCYLVDPSFVRHLAVGKGPYPDSGFGFSRFARTDFFDPRRQRTYRP
jgi:hypothetical protein